MPATLFVVGEVDRNRLTADAVVQELLSQTSETSSSVGPRPFAFKGDSEKGMQPALARIVAGEVVMGSSVEFAIPR